MDKENARRKSQVARGETYNTSTWLLVRHPEKQYRHQDHDLDESPAPAHQFDAVLSQPWLGKRNLRRKVAKLLGNVDVQ
ncbi:hypothetical protein RB195_012803 [Necator americanus]|uniref:Uncharacterized protein n=1 Tax=Necator americanus TaxID=51031 RepID=A0ABR1DSN1_NECAM